MRKTLILFLVLIPLLFYGQRNKRTVPAVLTPVTTIPDVSQKLQVWITDSIPTNTACTVYQKKYQLYVRGYYNATHDVVTVFELYVPTPTAAPADRSLHTEQFYIIIPKATTNTTKDYIQKGIRGGMLSLPDAVAPVSCYNTGGGTGNHTIIYTARLIATGHGLTNVDLGSVWRSATDNPPTAGNSQYYYLMQIGNDTLWFVQQSKSWSSTWYIQNTFQNCFGTPDKWGHVSGATHTDSILASTRVMSAAAAPYQMQRLKNWTWNILIDGKYPIQFGKVYYCDFVDVIDEYTQINPRKINGVTNPTNLVSTFAGVPRWDIGDDYKKRFMRYRAQQYGSIIIDDYTFLADEMKLGATFSFLSIMANTSPLVSGVDDKRWTYAPGTTGTTYAWSGVVEGTTGNLTEDLTDAKRANPNFPIDRIIYFNTANAGDASFLQSNRHFAYSLGYILDRGEGTPANRVAHYRNKDMVLGTGTTKFYPNLYNSAGSAAQSVLPAGTVVNGLAYRQWYDPRIASDTASNVNYFQDFDRSVWWVYLDYHQNVTNDHVQLPAACIGKAITVIEKNADFALTSGTIVPANGQITATITNSYGFAVLKLQ